MILLARAKLYLSKFPEKRMVLISILVGSSQLSWSQGYFSERLLDHPCYLHIPSQFEAFRNPALLTESKGIELNFEHYSSNFLSNGRYPKDFNSYNILLPFFNGIRLGWTHIFTYNHGIHSFAIARPFHISKSIPTLSPGLSFKYDNVSSNSYLDAGISAKLPLLNGELRVGLYSHGLILNHSSTTPEDIYPRNYRYPMYPVALESQLNLQLQWSLPNNLLAFHSEFTLIGDMKDRDGFMEYLYRTKYLGFTIKPVPWVTFGYKIDRLSAGEFELYHHLKWDDVISRYDLKLRGYRHSKYNYMIGFALGLNLFSQKGSLFKNRVPKTHLSYLEKAKPKPNSVKTDSSCTQSDSALMELQWYRNRDAYQREKIGVFRGIVFPYFNTFGYVTTFLVPAGITNIVVGNYTTGYYLLVGATACLSTVALFEDSDAMIITAIAGALSLKVVDLILARRFVNLKNRSLRKKYKLIVSPTQNSLQLSGAVSF